MTDVHERPVLELRNATMTEIRHPERIITLLAVPYEQPSHPDKPVIYRGQPYTETFARGAFSGVEKRLADFPCRVNREHKKGSTVGKVERFDSNAAEGLIAEIKVVASPAGDEVLALAAEDMISPSVSFVVRGSDQTFDRQAQPFATRYIRRAFLDHIGMVEDPAYTGAGVLDVRGQSEFIDAAHLEPLTTPVLDEWLAYVASRRSGAVS